MVMPHGGDQLTAPLDVGQALVEDGADGPGCAGEVLEAHVAELPAVYVEVVEGDATGVDLVHVQGLLEPLPHLELGPALGLLRLLGPQSAGRVAGRHHGHCRSKENR